METTWIYRKGEILEKEEVDLERKVGMNPLTNYVSINIVTKNNTGRKTLISFNLRKYVEKQCNST